MKIMYSPLKKSYKDLNSLVEDLYKGQGKYKESMKKSLGDEKMDINTEIDKVAKAMEESTEDPKDQLFKTIQNLGLEGIKEKLLAKSEDGTLLLNEEDRETLKSALEDIQKEHKTTQEVSTEDLKNVEKAASPSMDDSYQAKYHQGKVYQDTVIQEDKADDDADEKLVKPKNAKMKHQGDNAPEGFEGQVIKAKDSIDIAEDAKETADQVPCPMDKKDKKDKNKPKTMGKNYNMKKSKEQLLEIKKAIEEELTKAGIEITTELVKAKMKDKLLAEEDQLGNDETEKAPKSRADTSRPEALKIDKENKDAQKKVNDLGQGKMKKAMDWADSNALLAANTNGRNHHFSINDYYDDALAKAENKETTKKEEPLEKSEDKPKEMDINDYIEKGMDSTQDSVICDARLLLNKAKIEGKVMKSFSDNQIAQALGLTEEEAKKLLGE